MKKSFEIWAHRGLHDHKTPENSLEAIQAALDAGLERIEIDVWLHEKEMVLTHDEPTGKHPLLKDALQLIDGKAEIYLELKHEPSAKKALAMVKKSYSKHMDSVIFASFDEGALRAVRKGSTAARLALNYRGIDNYFIDLAEELRVEYIGMNWKRVVPNFFNLKQAKTTLDVKLLAYTVNSRLVARMMKALGLNGMFTDKPDYF